jgi:hypothetical protein
MIPRDDLVRSAEWSRGRGAKRQSDEWAEVMDGHGMARRVILRDSLISDPRYRMLLVVVRLVVVAGDLKGELAMVERRLASE